MKKENVDLDKVREFHSPHPGHAGAMIPIPEPVRIAAAGLCVCSQKLSLREAVAKIEAVTNGEIEVDSEYKNISLIIKQGGLEHHFKVVNYR